MIFEIHEVEYVDGSEIGSTSYRKASSIREAVESTMQDYAEMGYKINAHSDMLIIPVTIDMERGEGGNSVIVEVKDNAVLRISNGDDIDLNSIKTTVVFVRGGSLEGVVTPSPDYVLIDFDNAEADQCPRCHKDISKEKCDNCDIDWTQDFETIGERIQELEEENG